MTRVRARNDGKGTAESPPRGGAPRQAYVGLVILLLVFACGAGSAMAYHRHRQGARDRIAEYHRRQQNPESPNSGAVAEKSGRETFKTVFDRMEGLTPKQAIRFLDSRGIPHGGYRNYDEWQSSPTIVATVRNVAMDGPEVDSGWPAPTFHMKVEVWFRGGTVEGYAFVQIDPPR